MRDPFGARVRKMDYAGESDRRGGVKAHAVSFSGSEEEDVVAVAPDGEGGGDGESGAGGESGKSGKSEKEHRR